MDIGYEEGLTRNDIASAYNKKYNKTLQASVLSRTLSKNNMKFNQLYEILDSIGYTIEIKKKI